MIRLGGLWKQKSKNGEPYLSGSAGPNATWMVFPVKSKTNPKGPDYTLVIAEKESRDDAPRPGRSEPPAVQDDEIPF